VPEFWRTGGKVPVFQEIFRSILKIEAAGSSEILVPFYESSKTTFTLLSGHTLPFSGVP
jgi:hypothetical protein